jgi:DNA ligase D-like protein (predicted ligase)
VTPSQNPFAGLTDAERALLRPAPVPERVAAMAATLSHEPVSGRGWVFERKLDGIRCIATKDGAGVRLRSRNDLAMDARLPAIAAAVARAPARQIVVDGEVVAFEGRRTSFARLQQRGERPTAVFLYAFDLLHLDGHDTTALPLLARKGLLRRALAFEGPLRWTPHRRGDGAALLRDACRRGWEGLIAKRVDAPYEGRRSRAWLKLKCEAGQELVIGGFTAPRGSRTELGALLVGYYEGGSLRYAGKVGTGFTRATLRDLAARLGPLVRDASPFADPVRERGATWAEPRLVAQVGFTEWTRAGRLRHPRYLGLREDKAAEDVVRER